MLPTTLWLRSSSFHPEKNQQEFSWKNNEHCFPEKDEILVLNTNKPSVRKHFSEFSSNC